MTDSGLRRLAVALVRHAGRALPKARFQWATAMEHEVGHITDDAAALHWAFGCVLASYKERVMAMGLPAVNPGPTITSPDDDPFLWLEEVDGPRALAWVEEQNAATLARFASDARFVADRDALLAIRDRADNIPWVHRHGNRIHNFWVDAEHPRGVWRTTTLESYRTGTPSWEVLLDVDALAAKEGEDWVWKGWQAAPRDPDRMMVTLSRGGATGGVLREFDLTTRDFVPNGFFLPEARGKAFWLDRDSLFLCSSFGEGMATNTGHARTVRLWRRGEDPLRAPVVFEGKPESMYVTIENEEDEDGDGITFSEQLGALGAREWIGDRRGAKLPIDVPSDAWRYRQHGWLLIKTFSEWSIGDEVYVPGTVVTIRFKDFLSGDRRFTRLFDPQPRRVVSDFTWSGGRVLLTILDDLEPVIEVLTPSASGWSRERIADLPQKGVVSAYRLDAASHGSNGEFIVQAENPLTPTSLFLIRPGHAPELVKRQPSLFNAGGLIVTRHEAISSDGERIPYTQIGPRGETDEAPVLLSGLGGWGIPLLPGYDGDVGKLWLERGGTRVLAHIRGGNEFGPDWQAAGRREGRRLVQDDFAAIAADLVRRGVTRPQRIAAHGTTVIANMLTRYPERFGALFCLFPIIDLRRLKQMKQPWIEELGDPDKPEDWAFMAPMSPYHAAVPGRSYPPILLATSRRAENMAPGHARKMAAKLQAMGYEAYYLEPVTDGYGHSKTNAEKAAIWALGYRFLRDAIGWNA